ncbi:TorD/DmsD family molecular chaperone [Falsiroseomonas selenitidurans]|uniref:Molecular chaperone TorD family protein n=1 Tax=Falsiroseomonas selenitidurans TaxID=2716335 RepID=A0ABX1E2P2_9PROT|nr:molecular chaperone TorD family protein [Falsiroseomonas selenitidurans]NKC29782.1 molecular chaperone TorD family protein [Falsiroseomonas selenitidurans]
MTETQDAAAAGPPRAGHTPLDLDPVDAERARLFALLGRLLGAAPDAGLLIRMRALAGTSGELGGAYAALARAAGATRAEAAEREFFNLFIGVGRGELLPYASYYLTGFLHERPLADLRGDLASLGIERAEGVAEPEDHIAFLCEAYAGLLAGAFAVEPDAAAGFFARHLRPWAAPFFADLEKAQMADFYKAVGRLGRVAVEIEAAAADLPA